ncbi:hypothetical protein Rhe02_68190 [Rhizocola hellebori]|uniref:Uncharacterized protein n=1 Tax=Rhizocola hellebori TaxID=1392758 RepID=A0A8J3QFP3_9ACTN|nr:hypothetical protein Rhe02_68190 [Rhizocola hellebori]
MSAAMDIAVTISVLNRPWPDSLHALLRNSTEMAMMLPIPTHPAIQALAVDPSGDTSQPMPVTKVSAATIAHARSQRLAGRLRRERRWA